MVEENLFPCQNYILVLTAKGIFPVKELRQLERLGQKVGKPQVRCKIFRTMSQSANLPPSF